MQLMEAAALRMGLKQNVVSEGNCTIVREPRVPRWAQAEALLVVHQGYPSVGSVRYKLEVW